MSASSNVPLFPLHTVLFPDGRLPLRIFEARYLDMISRSMRTSTPFGIVPIRAGREVGPAADFFPYGTLATVKSFDRGSDGLLNISVQGGARFTVAQHAVANDGLTSAEVNLLGGADDDEVTPAFAHLGALLEEILAKQASALSDIPRQPGSALWVSYRLAELLPLQLTQKLAILQAPRGALALARLDGAVANLIRRNGRGDTH
jgi:Lon protease-like protein